MSDPLIHTATAGDRQRCLAVLTLAFNGDPACRWTWPDPHQYLEAFPRFANAFGGGAIDGGTAQYYWDFCGVALWLPPGTTPDETALQSVMQETVAQAKQDAMLAMFKQMQAFHPHEPHWHLPMIGVDPVQQREGIASALLRHALQTCDQQGVAAYLEATTPRSVPLYRRHGFEALGTVQVGDSPPLVPMLRRPRAPDQRA